jgi:hypothetical protein
MFPRIPKQLQIEEIIEDSAIGEQRSSESDNDVMRINGGGGSDVIHHFDVEG